MQWESGRLIAERYKVVRFLDDGAAAEVYEAVNRWTNRRVALKRLRPEFADDPTMIERFLMEGRIGAQTNHVNVAQVLDMGQEASDRSFYHVQELLSGAGLRQVLQRDGALSVQDTLDLIIPVMGALVAIHDQGIIHRDIKPENIFLAETAFGLRIPKLLDFGIAKVPSGGELTQAGTLLGTPHYMSPEQAKGESDIDRRADVWAIGAVMYEMMAGRNPFQADTYATILLKVVGLPEDRVESLAPAVPPALGDIVHRALRKDRNDRWESMQGFLEALLRWCLSRPGTPEATLPDRHRISIPAVSVARGYQPVPSLRPSTLSGPSSTSSFRLDALRIPNSADAPPPAEEAGEPVAAPQEAPASGQEPVVPPPVSSEDRSSAASAQTGPSPLATTMVGFPLAAIADLDAERAAGSPTHTAKVEAEAGHGTQGATPAMADIDLPPATVRGAGLEEALSGIVGTARLALEAGSFEEARTLAEQAVEGLPQDGEDVAEMRMLQASALYWQARYVEAEACALDGLQRSRPGSLVWCRAVGDLAVLSGILGVQDRLADLAGMLRSNTPSMGATEEYAVAACKLSIYLRRAGWPELVEAMAGDFHTLLNELAEECADVRAWVSLMRAELASQAGDPLDSLVLTQKAVDAFEQAGDRLRATVYRSNVADSYMLLGDYSRAEEIMLGVIQEGARQKVSNIAIAYANLGLVQARLGRLEEGKESVARSIGYSLRRGDWRAESSARVYLSEVLLASGDSAGAEREARAAVECATKSPPMRAEALGMLATVLLSQPLEALMAASQAMELLEAMGGVDEGEARIRLAYALSLRSLGHLERARKAIFDARDRLLQRAGRISDLGWRESFLENIPEHAHTLQLADSMGTT